MANVASMSFEDRLGEVFRRTLPQLSPEARQQLAALIEPQSLAIIATVLVAWIAGHAFGVGEIVDVILGVVGVLSIGLAVFSGIDELWEFGRGTYSAGSDQDLDAAAGHLARAIAILGIQAVLAVLFKGRPRGGRVAAGPEPPPTPGVRYRPKTVFNPNEPAGTGWTTFWGDVEISSAGSANDRALVQLHERVHQLLAPKLYLLRRVRVENRIGSYFKSSLYRYIEEMLAETVAQVGVNGLSKVLVGLKFPVANGYVYLTRIGGYGPAMGGAGLIPEGAALIGVGSIVGFSYHLWFKQGNFASGPEIRSWARAMAR
jgi:hypothetical protein